MSMQEDLVETSKQVEALDHRIFTNLERKVAR